jgi:hypothetical protein
MKQYFKIMSMLIGGILTLGSLTACGGDDSSDTSGTPKPSPSTPTQAAVSIKVDYTATVSQQLLDVATVTVRYIGDNGQVASERMSSTTWKKSVTLSLPNKAGLSIQPMLKGTVADGEYTLSAKGQAAYNWLGQDGKQVASGATETTPEMEAIVNADGVGQYLGSITATCQLARAFAKDYSVTDTSIDWGGNAGDDNTQRTGIANDGATDDNR